jgi:hypothetical protein
VLSDFELDAIASAACMQLQRATLQALSSVKQSMDSSGRSSGALQRVYSALHLESFDSINYTLDLADLGFKSAEHGRAFLQAITKQFQQQKSLILHHKMLDEHRFLALQAQARQELRLPDLCGWAVVTSVYGRRSEK